MATAHRHRQVLIISLVLILHLLIFLLFYRHEFALLLSTTKKSQPLITIETVQEIEPETAPPTLPVPLKEPLQEEKTAEAPEEQQEEFASLYASSEHPAQEETVAPTVQEEQPEDSLETNAELLGEIPTDPTFLEKEESPASVEPVTPTPPALEVIPLPISFMGTDGKTVTEKDKAMHAFIKEVGNSINSLINKTTKPFLLQEPGPLTLRMIIVRTGKLAQKPHIVHSSGNQPFDEWYATILINASHSFPRIPPLLTGPCLTLDLFVPPYKPKLYP